MTAPAVNATAVRPPPPDLVAVGRIGEAYGLRGAVHVIPYSREADALLNVREWWLAGPGRLPLRDVEVFKARPHGDGLVAELVGMADRTMAEKLKGAEIHVARSRFPALAADEYYWTDLIGLPVVNERGVALGTVTGLSDNGAHAVLEIEDVAAGTEGKPVQRLIPFVNACVKSVERGSPQAGANAGASADANAGAGTGGRIIVDWEADY